MSRRAYKTVNLPREVVDWIDSIVSPAVRSGKPGPLGIHSRDEFVRIAVAILGTALQPPNQKGTPLDTIQTLLRQLTKSVNA